MLGSFFNNEQKFLTKIPDRDPGNTHKLLWIPWLLPDDTLSISFPQETKMNGLEGKCSPP